MNGPISYGSTLHHQTYRVVNSFLTTKGTRNKSCNASILVSGLNSQTRVCEYCTGSANIDL